jgi:hypothetical protein
MRAGCGAEVVSWIVQGKGSKTNCSQEESTYPVRLCSNNTQLGDLFPLP